MKSSTFGDNIPGRKLEQRIKSKKTGAEEMRGFKSLDSFCYDQGV